jgi:hypothetical protein
MIGKGGGVCGTRVQNSYTSPLTAPPCIAPCADPHPPTSSASTMNMSYLFCVCVNLVWFRVIPINRHHPSLPWFCGIWSVCVVCMCCVQAFVDTIIVLADSVISDCLSVCVCVQAFVVQENGQMKILVGQHHVHLHTVNTYVTSYPLVMVSCFCTYNFFSPEHKEEWLFLFLCVPPSMRLSFRDRTMRENLHALGYCIWRDL